MRILRNCDYESLNFIQNLLSYVSSEAASELLFKAKELSNRKEWKETPNVKIQAKKVVKVSAKKSANVAIR